jgi:uncharacterized membrane protein
MTLIDTFQDLVAQVPEFLQPLVVAAAGAVPFIEGEGAATIGILGGIHPVVAALAGIAGNFLCVLVLVLLSSSAHDAVVSRRRARLRSREAVSVGAPAVASVDGSGPGSGTGTGSTGAVTDQPVASFEEQSPRKAKFQRAFERYGVPGVSLLGPLLLPTQFTATMLAAAGVDKVRILVWQAVAIVLWTTALSLLVGGVLHSVQ